MMIHHRIQKISTNITYTLTNMPLLRLTSSAMCSLGVLNGRHQLASFGVYAASPGHNRACACAVRTWSRTAAYSIMEKSLHASRAVATANCTQPNCGMRCTFLVCMPCMLLFVITISKIARESGIFRHGMLRKGYWNCCGVIEIPRFTQLQVRMLFVAAQIKNVSDWKHPALLSWGIECCIFYGHP